MTAGDAAFLATGAAMTGLVLWAVWPRRRSRAGPRNNWQQRNVEAVQSGKSREEEFEDVPWATGDASGD